jgi:hypothetical protein
MTPDLAAHARDIIDANLYLILGTADSDGGPPRSTSHRQATESSTGSPPPTPSTPGTSLNVPR